MSDAAPTSIGVNGALGCVDAALRWAHEPSMHRACVLFGLMLGASAAACSSDDTSPGDGTDAGVDASLSNTLKCGAGGLTGVARAADATTLGPLASAMVMGAGCNAAATDEGGMIQADLAAEQPVKLDVTATGFIAAHIEATPQASGFDRTVYMFPDSHKATVFTGWTAGQGYALVGISPDKTDAGACSTSDGLVVSVKDHPEIAVGYLTDPSTRSATLAATDTLGAAVLGPIPAGTYEFDAVKAGCTAGPDDGKYFLWPQTMDVEADTLSLVQLKLP